MKPVIYIIISVGTIVSSCNDSKTRELSEACFFSKTLEGDYVVEEKNEIIGNFGDCKLIEFEDEVYILANLDNQLNIKKIKDADASFKATNPLVSSNWLDAIEDKGSILCVTASFADKSLRLYKIDLPSLNVEPITTVCPYGGQLLIDPTILKVEEKYLITYTQIKGNINNGDTLKQNGHYEVVLLESADLIIWKELSSVVSEDTNIEDGFLFHETAANSLFFLYEEEIFDKKNSALKIKNSFDRGISWGKPTTLLHATADQEPAAMFKCKEDYYLFYSSDSDKPGESYYGAKAYVSSFNNSAYKPQRIGIELELGDGILLYDVMLNKAEAHFLALKMNKDDTNVLVHYVLK